MSFHCFFYARASFLFSDLFLGGGTDLRAQGKGILGRQGADPDFRSSPVCAPQLGTAPRVLGAFLLHPPQGAFVATRSFQLKAGLTGLGRCTAAEARL